MPEKLTTRIRTWVQFAVLAVSLVALVSASAAVAGPAPEEVTKDGVLHVMNPNKPMEKSKTVVMEEKFRLGGEDDDEIFGVVTDVVADGDGNFYLLDSQLNEIKVYDPDGEYLRTIGREGEGPGEFQRAFNMFLVPGGNIGVLQTFPGKIVMLTPDGDPAGEYPLPEAGDGGFRVLVGADYAGSNLALVYMLQQPSETGFTQQNVLSLVEPSGEKEYRLHSDSSGMQAASPTIAEKEWDSFRNGRWGAAADGRAFAAAEYGKYEISVWNSKGNIDRVIHREYPDHERPEKEKQRILDLFKGFTRRIPIPDIKFEIEDMHNQITGIFARDDGTLWVLSSRGANDLEDGVAGIFDVYDKKGRFVRQVTLKGEGDPQNDGYFIVKDRLFVVTDWVAALMALQGGGGAAEDAEDEPELMQIISYRIDL